MSIKKIWFFCFVLCFLAFTLMSAEIHDAVLKGNLVVVKDLLAKDPALIDSTNEIGRTPLHLAAHGGYFELTAWLIKHGADVNRKESSYQLTPLHLAAWGGHLEVVRLLLKNGADLQAREKDNENALYYAALGKNLELVKYLVGKGLKVNDSESSADNTPLSIAIQNGNFPIVNYFISHGADPLQKKKNGNTMLHIACQRGKQELLRLLLKKGVAVNTLNNDQWTALHFASIMGNLEAEKVLLANKANANVYTSDGLSPLLMAARAGFKEMIFELLAAGAKTDAKLPDSGLSALHIAAAKGYGEIANALLANGADVNVKDKNGKTPYYYAKRYQNRKICTLLQEKGASITTEENPADRSWLSEPLTAGQAVVWYLGHSGWAVKTQNHLLVFDYWKNRALPDEPGLANGCIVPSEIKDQAVTVFISHNHADHYTPAVFDWKKEIKNITYIAGFKPEKTEGYTLLPNREKKELNGLEIIPIEANDSGQGYFVKVDGVNIFHPGDHANRQRDFSGPFKKEIDFLADQGLKADIIFAPVSGCGFGDIIAVKKGVYYTMDRLSARAVFPMHAANGESRYLEFAKEAKNAGYSVPVCCADTAGDHFLVTPEGVKWASVCVQKCDKKNTAGNCNNK